MEYRNFVVTDRTRSLKQPREIRSISPVRRQLPARKGLEYRNEPHEEVGEFQVIRQPLDSLRHAQDHQGIGIEEQAQDLQDTGLNLTGTDTDSTNLAHIDTNQEHILEETAHTRTNLAHTSQETTTTTMPSDISKMLTLGSKRSPSWDGDAKELNEFFEDFEELAKGANLTDAEKVKWVLKYVDGKKHVKFWKTREGYSTGQWTEFKKTVIAQYPGAKDGQAYSTKDMEKITDSFAKKKAMDEDDLIDYYSRFCPVAAYLIDKKKISPLEQDRGFWKGLPKLLRHELKLRFNMEKAN